MRLVWYGVVERIFINQNRQQSRVRLLNRACFIGSVDALDKLDQQAAISGLIADLVMLSLVS